MSRFFLALLLAVGLLLGGCAPPEPHTEGAGNEQRAEKAANDEGAAGEKPSEQRRQDPVPEADGDDKNRSTEGPKLGKPGDGPGPRSSASAATGYPEAEVPPEKTLAFQYQHINSGYYRSAYELFDDQSRRLVSLEQYKAYFASVAPYEITGYSFPFVQVRGDLASVVADLAVSSSDGEERYEVTQRLVREDGAWRVVMRDEQVASFTAGGRPSPSAASASASASAAPIDADGEFDATVTVSRVVDGDTVEISPAVDGNEEVRLIGIDTPETKDPEEGVEPYGPEASEFAIDALTGQEVGLEFDVERTDQYGRLLAYVYAGGGMFNEELVAGGYAQAYPYEPNTRYEERFAAAQEEAKAADLGIWGLPLAQQCELADRGNGIGEGTPGCPGSSASPSASTGSSGSASASASSSASATAGGAPASSGGDIDCDRVDGPIPTPPGDPNNLDGDGDGLACE